MVKSFITLANGGKPIYCGDIQQYLTLKHIGKQKITAVFYDNCTRRKLAEKTRVVLEFKVPAIGS
jgi:hypothetical protein